MRMRFPSNKTLAKICVYGAVGVISSVFYMRIRIQNQISNSDYFKEAFKLLRAHPGAIKYLGEPIKHVGFQLEDAENNNCDGQRAKFTVKVKGPKDRGTMYFKADHIEEKWIVSRLELELKSIPDQRLLIAGNIQDTDKPIESVK